MNSGGDDENEASDTNDPNASDDTSGSATNESNDTAESDANETDDTTGSDATGSDDTIEKGDATMVQVWLQVVDADPEDEEVIHSSDDRLEGVSIFTDLFRELEKASEVMNEEQLATELFVSRTRGETEKGHEVLAAKSQLPLIERSINDSPEEGIYVEHRDIVVFLYFREYSED